MSFLPYPLSTVVPPKQTLVWPYILRLHAHQFSPDNLVPPLYLAGIYLINKLGVLDSKQLLIA
jgi:hypothetical protein